MKDWYFWRYFANIKKHMNEDKSDNGVQLQLACPHRNIQHHHHCGTTSRCWALATWIVTLHYLHLGHVIASYLGSSIVARHPYIFCSPNRSSSQSRSIDASSIHNLFGHVIVAPSLDIPYTMKALQLNKFRDFQLIAQFIQLNWSYPMHHLSRSGLGPKIRRRSFLSNVFSKLSKALVRIPVSYPQHSAGLTKV